MAIKGAQTADVDPLRIAWLLRADLRRGDPARGPISDWFKMWWLINAQREYPKWAKYGELQNAGLFKAQQDSPMFGGFGMTPALRFFLDTSNELASTFDVATDEGLCGAIAWLYIHAVRDHQLAPALDEKTLDALDAVPPFLTNKSETGKDAPELTWLMFFLWETSRDLKANFDLRKDPDRQAYLKWFLLDGVQKLKLGPLLASRWREWLREPVLTSETGAVVPRATHLLWQRHTQLQHAFDVGTNIGVLGLALWSQEVWHTQPQLSWIDQVAPAEVPQTADVIPLVQRPFGLNLIGFAFGELGIGEDVRMAVAACEAAGIPFALVNIDPGDNLRQADHALAAHVAAAVKQDNFAPYSCNLFCLTAFDTARVFLEQGALFEHRYNIGWWPWELPVWPSDWHPVFNLVDEVWAATSFTYRTYTDAIVRTRTARIPVTLMPMAASVDRVKPMTREALRLPDASFLFLYVFDFNSFLARKNPFAAVKAFTQAFDKTDSSVGLVLKTMNANPQNPEWKQFLHECSQDKRIFIIDRTMERGEVLGLIQSCDAYLSLHRAEGFGRTLAEAMLFGRAVVSTDFSGNADFVREGTGYPVKWSEASVKIGEYPFVTSTDAAWWAEPSIESAAQQMRKSRERALAEYTRELDEKTIFNIAQERFSPATVGSAMLARLQNIAHRG